MIVEGLLNAILSLLQVIFGWINLPSFPADLENTLWSFEKLMFSSIKTYSKTVSSELST